MKILLGSCLIMYASVTLSQAPRPIPPSTPSLVGPDLAHDAGCSQICGLGASLSDTAAATLGHVCTRPIPPHLLNSPHAKRALGGAFGDPVTIVLDFKAPGEPNSTDIIGNEVTTFDVTGFGFLASDFDLVAAAVHRAVQNDYLGIPWDSEVPSSPLPEGQTLDVAVVIGDIGTPPGNGASEYYYVQIGSSTDGSGPLGQASLSAVRNAAGDPSGIANGSVVGTVFSDNVNGLGGLNPPDALTSGNLPFTTHALAGTAAHEAAHALSLLHLNVGKSVTPTGLDPLLATGAIDLPNQARLVDREFAITGINSQAGGATQMHIQQLIGALGLQTTTIWVDFAYTGPESGTKTRPFNTLAEGLAAVPSGGQLQIQGGSTAETPVILQPVTLDATGGPVSIGG